MVMLSFTWAGLELDERTVDVNNLANTDQEQQEQIERVVAQMVERQMCDELTARRSLELVLNAFREAPGNKLANDLSQLCDQAYRRAKGKIVF